MKSWYQQKTTWAGAAIVLTGVGEMVSNAAFSLDGINQILIGLGLIFGRQAIAKVEKPA